MPAKNFPLLLLLLLSLLLSACGSGAPAATPTASNDPCSPANIAESVKKVNNLTREFDKYSDLASNTPQSQIVQLIPDMQRIQTWAEDQAVPPCLKTLKELQLAHIAVVINTLVAFMNTSDQTGVDQVNAGIAQARELHLQYDVERARLLGVTLTPAPPLAANLGTAPVNLLSAPDVNAPALGTLEAQTATLITGKTADGQWLQVQLPAAPDQRAWLQAALVQTSIPVEQIPVVTP